MRVALWHDLPSGGGYRALADQVAGLVRQGHAVLVAAPPGAERTFAPLDPAAEVEVVGQALPEIPPSHGFAATRWLHAYEEVRRSAWAQAEVTATRLERWAPDVVLAHPCTRLAVTPLARCLQVPSVLYLQEPKRSLYEPMPHLPWWAPPRGSWRSLRGAVRQAADAVIVAQLRRAARDERDGAAAYGRILVNSRFSREAVLRAYGLEAKVSRLGVDTSVRAASTGASERRGALSVGAFVHEKRPLALVEAAAHLPEAHRTLTWVANVVDPAVHRAAEALAARLGVRLQVHERASAGELASRYLAAAVVLYAPQLEPFGLVPLEAALRGAPVVALAEGGVRESVRDGVSGLLVDDLADLGPTAAELVIDAPRAEALRASAAAHVAAHWDLGGAAALLERHLVQIAAS